MVKIIKVTFKKEYESQFGKLFLFEVVYNDGQEKKGIYYAKSKDQKNIVAGTEMEISEEIKTNSKGQYFKISPAKKPAPFERRVKQEQARYSSFAVAYVKDLIIADKVKLKDWVDASRKICKAMIDMDKDFIL